MWGYIAAGLATFAWLAVSVWAFEQSMGTGEVNQRFTAEVPSVTSPTTCVDDAIREKKLRPVARKQRRPRAELCIDAGYEPPPT